MKTPEDKIKEIVDELQFSQWVVGENGKDLPLQVIPDWEGSKRKLLALFAEEREKAHKKSYIQGWLDYLASLKEDK